MQKQQVKTVNSTSENTKNAVFIVGRNIVIHLLIFVVVCAVALAADINSDLFYVVSLSALTVGNLITGFITGKKKRRNGLIFGIVFSLPSNFIIIALSLIFNGFSFDYKILITVMSFIVASAVGGITAVNLKSKVKIKR